MSIEETTFTAEGAELITERVFAAPPELVWRAFTQAGHLEHWWGPHGTTTTVVELDLRPGGTWRFVSRGADGRETPFRGRYLELDPPRRLVQTFGVDVEALAGQVVTETTTFTAHGTGTLVSTRSAFPSAAALDAARAAGMARGAAESHERLDALLSGLTVR